MTAAHQLAEFAVHLKFEQIPAEVLERAKDCVIDTVAACVFGAQLPWTQTVIDYAKRNSAPGDCSVFGTEELPASPGLPAQACRVTLRLKNGREVAKEGHDFKGTPTMPLTPDELLEKFLKLTAHRDSAKAERLYAQLAQAEKVADFSELDFAL